MDLRALAALGNYDLYPGVGVVVQIADQFRNSLETRFATDIGLSHGHGIVVGGTRDSHRNGRIGWTEGREKEYIACLLTATVGKPPPTPPPSGGATPMWPS